jgi:hypothetical protein
MLKGELFLRGFEGSLVKLLVLLVSRCSKTCSGRLAAR